MGTSIKYIIVDKIVNTFNLQRSDNENKDPIIQKTTDYGYLLHAKTLKKKDNLDEIMHVATTKVKEAIELVGGINNDTRVVVYDNIYKIHEKQIGYTTSDCKLIEVNYKNPHIAYHELGHYKDFQNEIRKSRTNEFNPIVEAYRKEVENNLEELKSIFTYLIQTEMNDVDEKVSNVIIEDMWEDEYGYLILNEEIYARMFYEHIRVNNPHLDLPNPINQYEQLAEICYKNNRELISEYFKSEYPHLIQTMLSEEDFQLSDTLSL